MWSNLYLGKYKVPYLTWLHIFLMMIIMNDLFNKAYGRSHWQAKNANRIQSVKIEVVEIYSKISFTKF